MALVTPLAVVGDTADVGSPMWWLRRLTTRLYARIPDIDQAERYYEGKHKLAYASKKFRDTFGNLFAALADNWCGIVADAVEERLNVQGFRFGNNPDADKDAWALWQANYLDADSQLAHIDSIVAGYGYGLVWADADGDPLITIESPRQAIVAHVAGSRRDRAAGMKQWRGDDGRLYAYVYLPDEIYKYRSATKVTDETGTDFVMEGQLNAPAFWEPWHDPADDRWPLVNTLGCVPLVPFYNRTRTGKPGMGMSELTDVIPLQDAVNKLLADLILASEYGAFRQRWATGLTLDEDDKGQKINPFKHGPGNLWTAEASDGVAGQEAHFGEFSETNLQNIIKAIEMTVQHVASQSRTPPHYLNASASRLSGESIKAAETGLVAKVRRKFRPLGESWEEVMRLAFAVADDPRATETAAETVWGDPETRTEAQHTDAVVKKQQVRVPDQQLWEDLGYSPQQIARFEAMRAQEALMGLLTQPQQITERLTMPATMPLGTGTAAETAPGVPEAPGSPDVPPTTPAATPGQR